MPSPTLELSGLPIRATVTSHSVQHSDHLNHVYLAEASPEALVPERVLRAKAAL